MAGQINKMSFAHLKQSDSILLKEMLADPRQRERAVLALVGYLSLWSRERWIDEEKIYFLGKDISSICPPDFRQELIEAVRLRVAKTVTDIFVAGFAQVVAGESQAKSLPSIFELNRLVARLKMNTSPSLEQDIENLVQRYLAVTERGENPAPLVTCVGSICEVLVKVRGPSRLWAANFARRLVQDSLKWAIDSDRLWALWGRSLAKAGAFEAAELVYWEAVRRFPWNMHIRSQLIEVVKAQPNRFRDALVLAHQGFRYFPDSKAIAVQYARLLGQSEDKANLSTAIDLLSARMQSGEKVKYEISALAWILAAAEKTNNLKDEDLRLLIRRLQKQPQLLGGISNFLLDHHYALAAAQRLWRRRVAEVPDDPIGRSQLARAFARAGSRKELMEAIQILRQGILDFSEVPSLRNHLAKVLASTGERMDRSEAIGLFRETMERFPDDQYARHGLAELLLSSGDTRDRNEAVILLEKTTDHPINEYSRRLLALISATPQGIPVTAEAMERVPINTSYDDEDLQSVDAVDIQPSEVISANVMSWGRMRLLRHKIDYGSDAEKESAVQEVMKSLREDPNFAYPKLLAIRQGIWAEEDTELSGFAFAFEHALRNKDHSALEMLAERFPRFVALTIVARAMFGDERSAAKIVNLFSVNNDTLHPAARVLERLMRPHLKLIIGGRAPGEVVVENVDEIRTALYDANESTLYMHAIAA